MGTVKSWLRMQERERPYDYSDRWTLKDGETQKLIWLTVHEFTITYDALTDLDSIRQIFDIWHETAEAKWIKANVSEDIRIEQRDLFDVDSFQSVITFKVMARFYEEMATIYLLKWK